MGVFGTDVTPHEVRVKEAAQSLAVSLACEPHESVAHVNANAMSYVEAAEYSMANGEALTALYRIGVAEGIAIALRDVVGLNGGAHEQAVLKTVLQKMVEIRLECGRRCPSK
jgi:hypothetical protein